VTTVVHNIGRLYTMAGPDLGVIEDATVVIDGGRVVYADDEDDAPTVKNAELIDARGRAVMPGLVDCHTHLIFAGSRRDEFALRSKGASYAEILEAGGGILNTTKAVRAASEEELIDLARPRVQRMLARGVTCVEVKTGYGLELDAELKCLSAIRHLDEEVAPELVPTFLGAHAVPEGKDKSAYIDEVLDMLPRVASEGLAEFCDIFIDRGAFTVADGERVLGKAKELGLGLRVHAEQLSQTGAAGLAAELGAVSASHLEHISDEDIAKLAAAGTSAEVLSLAQVFLGMEQRIPGRKLADAGLNVAVATDMNPGSAHSCDLHLAAGLAVTMCGLTADEALWGITAGGARALGREDRGVLTEGAAGDLVILDGLSAYDLVYDWGENHVDRVFKAGVEVSA
jgi:imidazolonepropionase